MGTATWRLTPHDIPPELLEAIVEHVPDDDIPRLALVNKTWRSICRPHLCRTLRFSGTQWFHNALLSKTHTLEVGPHPASACYALMRDPPTLPKLRILRLPMDSHRGDHTPCALLWLGVDTLVHTGVSFERQDSPPCPPDILRVRNHVLEFAAYKPPRQIREGATINAPLFKPWLDLKGHEAVAKHLTILLPIPPADAEGVSSLLADTLELVHKAISIPRTVTLVGGCTDCRVFLHERDLEYTLEYTTLTHGIVRADGRVTAGVLLRRKLHSRIFREECARLEREGHDRGTRHTLSCRTAEKRKARLRIASFDDVLKSGELDGVVSRTDLRRVAMFPHALEKPTANKARRNTGRLVMCISCCVMLISLCAVWVRGLHRQSPAARRASDGGATPGA
jgi:hypothetical protein